MRPTALETELGVDNVRDHPELVHTEGTRAINQVTHVPPVNAGEIGFSDERSAGRAEACDRHLIVSAVRHW